MLYFEKCHHVFSVATCSGIWMTIFFARVESCEANVNNVLRYFILAVQKMAVQWI